MPKDFPSLGEELKKLWWNSPQSVPGINTGEKYIREIIQIAKVLK